MCSSLKLAGPPLSASQRRQIRQASEVVMGKNKEVTGKKAASAASKTLRSKTASKAAKSAAGSALSQRKAPQKVTKPKAASAASKTLRKGSASKAAKSAAGSALTQKPNKGGKKRGR